MSKEKSDKTATVKDFAESIRARWSTIYLLENGEKEKIIPYDFSHEFLLEKFNVDALVKEYYYKACSEMLKENDFEKFKASGFTGNKETILRPYSVSFYGAYHFRKSLYSKLNQSTWDNSLRLNGKSIESIKDLFPYFEEYSKGFKNGFDTFQTIQVEKYLNKFSSNNDFTQKVFDFIINNDWKNNRLNFETHRDYKKNKKVSEIIGGYKDGELEGFFYNAWSIIFSNSKLYLPLFESLKAIPLKVSNINKELEIEETTQEELIHISQDENKFLKGIPMQVVINHFNVFTASKNKNGEVYLTDYQFISFLKKCFLNDKREPIQKINFAKGEKGFVIKRFYEFYEIACRKYFVHNSKAPFIDRFTECIEFGEESSFKSYFKNKNIKKQW